MSVSFFETLTAQIRKNLSVLCVVSFGAVIAAGMVSLYYFHAQDRKELAVESMHILLNKATVAEQHLSEAFISRSLYSDQNKTVFNRLALAGVDKALLVLDTLEQTKSTGTYPTIQSTLKLLRALQAAWQPTGTAENSLSVADQQKAMRQILFNLESVRQRESKMLQTLTGDNQRLRRRTETVIISGTVLILIMTTLLILFSIAEYRNRRKVQEKEAELDLLKENFITLASHEFRTPLSAIQLSASLLAKYAVKSEMQQVDKHAAKIRENVYHLKCMLEDFLSVEQLHKGDIQPVLEWFDVDLLAEEIFRESRGLFQQGQEFSYACNTRGLQAFLDRRLLKATVITLLSNAAKYSGEHTAITLHIQVSGNMLELVVKDNGKGISGEQQRKLFDPFYRVQQNGNIPGTGLGLYVARKYVELMNGRLGVFSIPNRETSFRIVFPSAAGYASAEGGLDIAVSI
ncbi:ATP-binding protein [Mucilaginibacter sp. RS28]|uniref:histidine kinase n=1 Tax=Mucilaginibacter straminoryzae TaxID=2932774 RepID=A0A9X2B8E2_9SPHI|nr:ATP-binding protein [Mucilaginibacter straminoryzae]MCJ8208620.1 ATP-binding protein [Mucilaginibacter straminoryzae]